MLLFLIATFFLNETFPGEKAANKWSTQLPVTECAASSILLNHFCTKISKIDEKLIASTDFEEPIQKLPLLVHFTTKTVMPTTPSNISFSLISEAGAEIKLNIEYTDDDPIYSFTDSAGNITMGRISHERELTNSLTISLLDDNSYSLYVNGIILHIGNLSKPINFPISKAEFSLQNGNTTTEIGNLYVTDNISLRYDILIKSLLQTRPCERAIRIKSIVDDEEMRLFEGLPLNEPLDKAEEYGVPKTYEKADPRRFIFPLSIKKPTEKMTKTKKAQTPQILPEQIKDPNLPRGAETQEQKEIGTEDL